MSIARVNGIDEVTDRVIQRSPSARAVVSKIVSSRKQHESASREIERGIQRLAALGVTQRDIAVLAGLSQPEVSRRLKRTEVVKEIDQLHRLVAQREAGELTSAELVEALSSAVTPRRKPGRVSAYDGSASSPRALAELMRLFRSGAITRDEYTGIRTRLGRRQMAR